VLANDKTRQALMDLYAGDDKISEAFRQGAGSRMQSAQELTEQKNARAGKMAEDNRRMADKRLDRDGAPASPQALNAQMLAASNGAAVLVSVDANGDGVADSEVPELAWTQLMPESTFSSLRSRPQRGVLPIP
jgi:hypothetical protein